MKRKLLFAIVALMCSIGTWAQPTASTPAVGGTYYLYNPLTKLFMTTNVDLPFIRPTGKAWKLEAADGHDGWITLRLVDNTTDGEGYFWGKWWANNPNQNSANYADERVFQLVNISGTNYKLKSYAWGDTEAYIYINKGNQGDCSFRLACNSQDQSGLDEGYVTWQFISETDYAAYMADDYTSRISNNDFLDGVANWTLEGSGNKQAHGNTAIEYWNGSAASGSFDYYQDLSDLPAGQYVLRAAMYNSTNGEEGASFNTEGQCGVYGTSNNVTVNANVTEDGTGYNIYTTEGLIVSDGNLRLGFKNTTTMTARWFGVDWIQLICEEYCISAMAKALPDGGAMEAGKWYYFDIPVDGIYNITATDLSQIVYTKDASILMSEESSVTTHFAGAENQELTAGRFFVKSTSDQTLEITTGEYAYNIGAANLSNADGSYTQTSTFTVTFPAAATSDPNGAVALVAGSKATVNGAEVALTAVENGFSLELGTITAGATYAIVIPAGVFGYANESMNEQISVTLNAPAVLDGIYFLRTSDGKYASRGGNYNTRAMVDEFGLPMHLKTGSNGISEFIYVDSYFHLFDAGNGTVYTDNHTNPNWKVQRTEDGYTIINANDNGSKDKFLGIVDNHLQSIDDSYVWILEPASEHKANVEPLKDAQAVAAATAAGITASTKAELAAEVAANYNAVPVTITGVNGFQEEYQVGAGNEFAGNGHTTFTETVENLTPGLYKLTVKAFHRMTWYADVESASGVSSNVYVFAGDAKTQICSPFDAPAATAWVAGNDYKDAGDKYYPNNPTGAGAAFDAGNYVNEVWVYVSGTSLTFGIFNPNRLGNDGSRGAWLPYRDFTLTRYEQASASMAISDAKYGTFIAPFDVTIPEGVTAYTVDGADGAALTMTEVATTIPANTPVVVYSEDTVNETFNGKSVAAEELTKGLLVGTYEDIDAPLGSYVLQNHDGKVGFYKVGTSATPKVRANRAYLTEGESGVKAFYFGGDADAIQSVFDGLVNGDAYDLGGRKVSKLQKGNVYIVTGKKVVVK